MGVLIVDALFYATFGGLFSFDFFVCLFYCCFIVDKGIGVVLCLRLILL